MSIESARSRWEEASKNFIKTAGQYGLPAGHVAVDTGQAFIEGKRYAYYVATAELAEAYMDALKEAAQKYLEGARESRIKEETRRDRDRKWQIAMVAATVIYAVTFFISYVCPRGH